MPLIIVLWVALLSTVMNTHAQGVECASPQAQGNSPLCAALGKLNGHWKDTRFCDVFHACISGEQKKTYSCAQLGERIYFDETTRR
jgi:hypothetical protein